MGNKKPKGTLVLVRHGESRFNEMNLFTGWLDIPLTEKGIDEARSVARHCEKFDYDAVFTSHLERARETLVIILSDQERIGIFHHSENERYDIPEDVRPLISESILPVYSNESLNERSYGLLQGMDKKKVADTYGDDQVLKWRRGFLDTPPGGESLKDVYDRSLKYFQETIMPRLEIGETNLIVAHGNTLRALIKFLDNIDDNKISFIDLPFGEPLVYEYEQGVFERVEGCYNFERILR